MAEKFNPAPHDRHAVTPEEAARADAEMHAKLEAGLIAFLVFALAWTRLLVRRFSIRGRAG